MRYDDDIRDLEPSTYRDDPDWTDSVWRERLCLLLLVVAVVVAIAVPTVTGVHDVCERVRVALMANTQ